MTSTPELFPESFLGVLRRALALGSRIGRGGADPVRRASSRMAEVGGFAGHRGYVPGDDARRVDWSAYARSGELFVKTFEDEQGRDVTLLLDRSASMQVHSRYDHARRGAAFVAAILAGRGDRVRILAQHDDAIREFAFSKSMRLAEMLDWLREIDVAGSDSDRLPGGLGRRSRLIWISDFAEVDRLNDRLRRLGGARRRTVAILPRVAIDREVTDDGVFMLRCVETGRRLRVRSDRRLREQLRTELRRQAAQRREIFGRIGIRLLEWDPPSAPALDGRRTTSSDWLGGPLVTTIFRQDLLR